VPPLDGAAAGEVAAPAALGLPLGAVAGAVTGAVLGPAVTVVAGAVPGWLGVAEPHAATSEVAAATHVSHAIRRIRPAVLAAIVRLAPRARLVVMAIGARAEGREDVDMACSFILRGG
jgi:hypothetical protein